MSTGDIGHIAIVGMGRSGSTFLEGTLARELRGVAVGELPGLWAALSVQGKLCACGDLASQCSFWAEVSARYKALTDTETMCFMRRINLRSLPIGRCWSWPWISRRAHLNFGDEGLYRGEVAYLYRALREAAAVFGYRTIIDSSKHPLWYNIARGGGALDQFSPRTAVRLVRHPRGVVYSLQRPRREQTLTGEVDLQIAYNFRKAILYWVIMNVGGDLVTKSGAIRVKYETLGHSSDYLAQLRHLGFTNHHQEGHMGAEHQIVGNPSRQQADRAVFRADERWREAQPSFMEYQLWRMLAPLLARYGYDIEPTKQR